MDHKAVEIKVNLWKVAESTVAQSPVLVDTDEFYSIQHFTAT